MEQTGDFYTDLWNGLIIVWLLLGWIFILPYLALLIRYLIKPYARIICLKSLIFFCSPFLIFYILEYIIRFQPPYDCFQGSIECTGGRLRDILLYSSIIVCLCAIIYLPLKARKL